MEKKKKNLFQKTEIKIYKYQSIDMLINGKEFESDTCMYVLELIDKRIVQLFTRETTA